MRFYVPAEHNALVRVTDERNQPHYLIQSLRSFELNGVRVLSLSADTLGEAHQSSLKLLPSYTLTNGTGDETIGQINRLVGVWREVLFVSGLNWLVVGDITQNQYNVFRGNKKVWVVDTLNRADDADYFVVDVADPANEVPALLVAAVLNRWRKVPLRSGVRNLLKPKKKGYVLGDDFAPYRHRRS